MNQNDSDIVCITETWFSTKILDNAIPKNSFALFWKYRDKHGGDISIFLESNIRGMRLVVPDIPECVTEILWLQVRPRRLPEAV